MNIAVKILLVVTGLTATITSSLAQQDSDFTADFTPSGPTYNCSCTTDLSAEARPVQLTLGGDNLKFLLGQQPFYGAKDGPQGDRVRFSGFGWILNTRLPTYVDIAKGIVAGEASVDMQLIDGATGQITVYAPIWCDVLNA